MGFSQNLFLIIAALVGLAEACSNGQCRILDECSSNQDCEAGLYCFTCPAGSSGSRCVRSTITDQFKLLFPGRLSVTANRDSHCTTQTRRTWVVSIQNYIEAENSLWKAAGLEMDNASETECINNSLPFNKYAFLTTHNAYAIDGYPSHTGVPRITLTNQEDSITEQLNNGARALMLDTYDFRGDVWLCHSFKGQCYDYTAFKIMSNAAFTDAGLMKYRFPVTKMPRNGHDWPLVSDMIQNNQRLLVFTSVQSKEASEGIAYQWNYMVENQYGDGGMKAGSCTNRGESPPLDDKSRSLVLVNYFRSIPMKQLSCGDNSGNLINMLHTCNGAAPDGKFVAVDHYKRSEGGGSFQAVDLLNGKLLCGCDDLHACVATRCLNLLAFIGTMAKPETSLNLTVKFSVLMFRPRLQGITKLTRSASCLLFLGSVNHRSSSFRTGQRRAELEVKETRSDTERVRGDWGSLTVWYLSIDAQNGISIDAPQELEFDVRSGKYGTRSHGLRYTPLHDIRSPNVG
uniref:PI-PLC X domain-containing protein n=1 Tax=Salix viminalis TaxID=40686 RepID=A0A6N2N0B8_SALVM